ncbi:hypothetical protein A2V61_02675 [Candidatus Woesebacteria bacterium RBG_19FT_COMBO_47_8]|uniref:Uncharacterized protein n=1 Tax=Candidatus Woesebacteria bacterium RBG_13_46_13 TaxID=1802479 RepID=A0A1F7X3J0_9BACT|nr:MAG: hypothetical protein A2Y68_03510 [Candidatus Woesebacteria bacterium RBG_13_46_13]OGM18114.1 MAG: hypothetical protein A2V61_02675 [Candidatus Woesebacteria bacterium RBG_19FT_COMBO_47_8]HJX59613.1 hypothetical protein [Patescibacteria group bacterium]
MKEHKEVSPSSEINSEGLRFSPEQRLQLERRGYIIYHLSGQSIESLREAGLRFSSDRHKGKWFETVASMHGEVAINPKDLLTHSNIERVSREIAEQVSGTRAIIGNLGDYAELAFKHLNQTGQRLFGKDFGLKYTETTNHEYIGHFDDNSGLTIYKWEVKAWTGRGDPPDIFWTAPLIVPTSEHIETPKTVEAPIEIDRFSPEQREILERKGYVIYPLTGQSIKSLRDAGWSFNSSWFKGTPLDGSISMRSEVAINPKKPFLPESNMKTLAKQLELVNALNKKIQGQIHGTTAVLGSVADYAELIFFHFDHNGYLRTGTEFNFFYTRTSTLVGKTRVAIVGKYHGGFGYGSGLELAYQDKVKRYSDLRVAPLVVPVSATIK